MPLAPAHHAALRAHFGFAAFRPGQEAAVTAALAGRDALVVMPTGAGKSLCYQLPALMRDDLTLVVTPLVSLMADQVQALARRAPGRVAQVNGQQTARENAAALARAVDGEVRVLHVAPERFAAPGFLDALSGADVGLFVVDEAHCVSEWGHDFRPDYLRLGAAARALGAAAIVASTATATPQVAADIVERLGLRDPLRVATGFDRPNLSFAVVAAPAPAARPRQALAVLAEQGATPAIVYAGTRRAVEALAAALEGGLGRPVAAYHAGLDRHDRARAQARFMRGEVDVVVATNAFGMGVDKADVRTVLHVGVPASVEAYYQEAGRAGRDGRPARAVLLAAPEDKGLHVHFVRRAAVTDGQVAAVAQALEAAAGGSPVAALPGLEGAAPAFDVATADVGLDDPERARAVAGTLARAGVVALHPAPHGRIAGHLVAPWGPDAAARCAALLADAQRARWRRYHAAWAFVDGTGCRRAALLAHFGDAAAPRPDGPCCDVCDPGLAAVAATAGGPPPLTAAALEAVILAAVAAAAPPLAPPELVGVLRGDRTRAMRAAGHDGLPAYGTWDHLATAELRAAVDGLVATGRLRLDGERLAVAGVPARAAA